MAMQDHILIIDHDAEIRSPLREYCRTPWLVRTLCRILAVSAATLIVGCSSIRYDVPRPPSHAIDHPEETFLWRSFASPLAATPGQSGFHLLVSGQEAFLARAAGRRAIRRRAPGIVLRIQPVLGGHPAREGCRGGPQIRARRFDESRSAVTAVEYRGRCADRERGAG